MRLLIAEDEIAFADALAEILTMHHYSVDVVHDGRDALDYLTSGVEYDGVILDVMMPKLDGISVLRSIRAQRITTPVLILTAKGEIDDRVAGLDSGADDYLVKPFDTKELLARIRAMTRRVTQPLVQGLSLGNTSLDPQQCSISTPSGSLLLTNKEFQLLEMLLRNQGCYVSSEQFMEKIWGWDSDSQIHVVWTHLSSLRRKLGQIHSDLRIRSARNLGYLLEVHHDS